MDMPQGPVAYIALGSNLGDSIRQVRSALEKLQALSSQPIRSSSLWRSSPVNCPPGSPDFINAVAAIDPMPEETPESLLAKLQAFERAFGREPKQAHNESRPLDLDLLAFGSEMRATAGLTLPHPRARLRRFVLEPLNEIAPELVLPGQKKSVRELLATLRTGEVVEKL
jgi:2-amino-4-hydroxy-6-hydroxymethyldihydropteridine diphosphokinase